jgi:hypothetical protein
MKLIAEFAMYAAFAAFVGALSVWPPYSNLDQERAIISLVFSHAGKRVNECRQLSQEELNELPPNMRTINDCPRERHPVRVELRSGTEILYQATLQPSGIWSDGKASIYQRIDVPSGVHELFVGVNDSGGEAGFDFEKTMTIELAPRRNLLVQFDEQTNEILIR